MIYPRLWPRIAFAGTRLLAVYLLVVWLSVMGCSTTASTDADTLKLLEKAGSDLKKPHQVIFSIHVPTEQFAKQAKAEMDQMGLFVQVQKEYDSYICEGSRTMVPKLEDIGALAKKMQSLADKLKGNYDGWRASVSR